MKQKISDDFHTIGEYVKYVREERHLTLRDVVELIKVAVMKKELDPKCVVSPGYLSSLEAGKYADPSPFKLKALAHIFNIGYELLLNKAGYLDHASNKIKQDANFTLMLKEVESLTPTERESVVAYIDFVKTRRKKTYEQSPKKG